MSVLYGLLGVPLDGNTRQRSMRRGRPEASANGHRRDNSINTTENEVTTLKPEEAEALLQNLVSHLKALTTGSSNHVNISDIQYIVDDYEQQRRQLVSGPPSSLMNNRNGRNSRTSNRSNTRTDSAAAPTAVASRANVNAATISTDTDTAMDINTSSIFSTQGTSNASSRTTNSSSSSSKKSKKKRRGSKGGKK